MSLKTESLASMCEAVVDCPHSTPVWTKSGYVVLRNQNIKFGRLDLSEPSFTDEEHFKQRVRRMAPRSGDIVITREAPMGEVCKIPDGLTCCLGQRQVLLRPKADVDADYLLYALQSPFVQSQIQWNEGTGSTVSNIRIPVLEKIEIPRHDQAETSIAKALSLLDLKIDLNREINHTLEVMAQVIFKSWFVDFDPVKAKIAAIEQGEDPLRAAMRAISGKTDAELGQMPREYHDQLASTAGLFPDAMEESELGEVPKGWSAVPFGSLLSHTIGGDWGGEAPDTINDTRVAIIRGTDIPGLDLAQSNRVPVRYTSQKKLATRRLQVGDIILEVSGGSKGQPTGRSFYMTANALREFDCPVEPASFCRLLRPISPEVGALLGLHLSRIYQQGKTWEYQNQSTGIANFQTSHFLAVELVVNPAKPVIDRFYEAVGPVLERRHDAQSLKLLELRSSLLPKLISGELLLTEADANHVNGYGL